MTVLELLQNAHGQWANDTDYPSAGSEEMTAYVRHLNSAIAEWEMLGKKNAYPWELFSSATIALGGTGADNLPDDFYCFLRTWSDYGSVPAMIVIGTTKYREVAPRAGRRIESEERSGEYVFWQEGAKLKTYPHASGSFILPYQAKATRFETGEETDEPECPDHQFLTDFVSSRIALDNEDDTKYELYAVSASEKLDEMYYAYLESNVGDSFQYRGGLTM